MRKGLLDIDSHVINRQMNKNSCCKQNIILVDLTIKWLNINL